MPFRRSNIRLCVYAGFYILYLVIGASVFSAIEGPQERSLMKTLKEERHKFFLDHQHCISDAELEEFITKIVQATNHGISAVKNVTVSTPNWSFGQSFFFAGTVITTIGYGRVTPLSRAGKAFCILYTLIGIPMTLIMFTALVERLMIPVGFFLDWMMRKLGHIYKVFHIKLIHVAIVVITVLVFFYLIPAAIYASLEPTWNYLDAFYYCFVSLTTVGLGDYIPGDSPEQQLRPLYKMATTFYLFIGLIAMMVLLAVIYEVPELNLGFHLYLRSDEIDEGERTRLNQAAGDATSSQRYTQQLDDDTGNGTTNYKGIPSFPRNTTTGYNEPNESE